MMRKLQEAKDRLESEKNNLMYAIEVFIAIMIMPIIRRITIFTTKMVIVKMVIMMIILIIIKRIMMIMIIMQVLKQQNFKLEASNANLSMMSSTMSPLQVIMINNHNNNSE